MKRFTILFLITGCGAINPKIENIQGTSSLPPRPTDETPNPFGDEQLLEPDSLIKEERLARLQARPNIASIEEVGFIDRPPRGWQDGLPRSHLIINDTKFAVRIFLDGKELVLVTAGQVVPMPIMTAGSIRPLPLVAPLGKVYHLGDAGKHALTIELYDGPAPLQYVKTCRIEANFMKQAHLYLSYRPCYKTNPSP